MIFNKGNTPVNFEELLLSEASRYRMYPSEKVWENIRKDIQPQTRWPALITIFVFIVLALTVSTIINYPKEKISITKTTNQYLRVATVKTQQKVGSPIFYTQNFYDKTIKVNSHIKTTNKLSEVNQTSQKVFSSVENKVNNVDENSTLSIHNTLPVSHSVVSNTNFEPIESVYTKEVTNQLLEPSIQIKNSSQFAINTLQLNDEFLNSKKTINKTAKSKWQVQYYATLSNSYRTLEDDKTRSRYISALSDRVALSKNVNDVVIHKPMTGAEIGATLLYPITKKLFIKTGIQFNIRQYNIDAYNAYGEANISFVRNNQLSTLSTISGYSTNFENALGAKTNLQNKLYEVSVPIGLEWNVYEGSKWGLSLTGSVEPTLALNRNNFIVSTDYKYYTDASPFVRNFNINTSAAMFFTMRTKSLKWFLGPQIRFQQLPTYNDLYPIKEYRVDYGIKIGFTKPLH
ncbi:MAG: hypothetical protein KGZ59_00720 [Chitinophagaceae bacterium]|nr:hypothetical protein [Chitinophagaceae bacterium]